MPRVAITVSIIDDDNSLLALENWSPLGYEDLGNPNLGIESTNGLLVNVERNLLERLRTSIDRTLLSFARRERRRWNTASRVYQASPQPIEESVDTSFAVQYRGEFLPPDLEVEHIEDNALSGGRGSIPSMTLAEAHEALRASTFADQPVVMRREPKKAKGSSKIKRVSRYKRDPVI